MYRYTPVLFFLTVGSSACAVGIAKEAASQNMSEPEECVAPICIKLKNLQHNTYKPVLKEPFVSPPNIEECIIRLQTPTYYVGDYGDKELIVFAVGDFVVDFKGRCRL